MGPQPEAEGNLPKDGSGGSSEDLPPIPIGTFAGFQPEEGTSSDDDEDGDHEETDRGGYQLLNADLNAAEVSKLGMTNKVLDGWAGAVMQKAKTARN